MLSYIKLTLLWLAIKYHSFMVRFYKTILYLKENRNSWGI